MYINEQREGRFEEERQRGKNSFGVTKTRARAWVGYKGMAPSVFRESLQLNRSSAKLKRNARLLSCDTHTYIRVLYIYICMMDLGLDCAMPARANFVRNFREKKYAFSGLFPFVCCFFFPCRLFSAHILVHASLHGCIFFFYYGFF